MATPLNIADYTHPILAAVFLMMECAALGGPVMGKRKEHFSEEFLEKNFGQECLKETGKKVPKYGYPDTGNGRFSRAWNVSQWLDFNKTMRTHLNLVEIFPLLVFILLTAGAFNPWHAGLAGYLIVVARVLYYFSYKWAPNMRWIGGIPTFTGIFWLVYIIYGGLNGMRK